MPSARIRYHPLLNHHFHLYLRPQQRQRRCFSSTSQLPKPVQLAYDLHEPPPARAQSHNNNNESSSSSPKKAPPIIFLHGLFGSRKNNRSMSKVLARDLNRPVYALDLRNHGDSPHDPIHDYPSMADDVELFIREHSLSHPTLIGHSMGAKTAMTLSLRTPTLISALISVDNAPIDAALSSNFNLYIAGMRAIESARVSKQSDALALLEPHEPSLSIRQFLLTNLVRLDTASPYLTFRIPLTILANALDKMADFPYKDPGERRFEKPALFVRGAESRYVPDDVLPLVGAFFPRFELVTVDGAGHWVAAERPEEFRRAVVEFLRGRDG